MKVNSAVPYALFGALAVSTSLIRVRNEKAETAIRVSLKPLTIANISKNYARWLNDADVNKFLEIRHKPPRTLEDQIYFVHNCEIERRHHWGIFAEDKHIGTVSCSEYKPNYKWVDISIVIGEKEYRGKGIAKRALAGAIEHLFTVSHFHRIQAGAYSLNYESINLFKRLGFKQEAVLRECAIVNNQFIDIIKLGLIENEWDQIKNCFPKAAVAKMNWENS